MKILAVDTATPASSVAIGEDGQLRGLSVNVDRRGHVKFLVPAIDFCLAQAQWRARDIDLVAVDVGPGPYTGLRAGIATAQAFASASGAPGGASARGDAPPATADQPGEREAGARAATNGGLTCWRVRPGPGATETCGCAPRLHLGSWLHLARWTH